MALNTFKCNYLTPLHFKGLSIIQLSYDECLNKLSHNDKLAAALEVHH